MHFLVFSQTERSWDVYKRILDYAAIGDIKICPVALKLDAGTFLASIAQGAVSVGKLKKRVFINSVL